MFDDNPELLNEFVSSLHRVIHTLEAKFRWLGQVPYVLVHSDTAAGAAECVRQIRSVPRAALDSLSGYVADHCMADLEGIASGTVRFSKDISSIVTALKYAVLSEGLAETYHRATHSIRKKAPNGSLTWICSKQRVKDNITLASTLIKTEAGHT